MAVCIRLCIAVWTQKAMETLLQAITSGTGKISNTLGPTEAEDSYNYHHKEEYPVEQGSMKPPRLEKVPVLRRVTTVEHRFAQISNQHKGWPLQHVTGFSSHVHSQLQMLLLPTSVVKINEFSSKSKIH